MTDFPTELRGTGGIWRLGDGRGAEQSDLRVV